MKAPARFAQQVEDHPQLPAASCVRVSGYAVMGLPFRSGHVLGLRRWTATSAGEGFTSIWHRDPGGRWTFYESVRSQIACTGYFGAEVDRVRVGPIRLDWEGPHRLHVRTAAESEVDWTIDVGSTRITRAMSTVGASIPAAAWRWRPVLVAMGHVAGRVLDAGKVQLTGTTPNGQRFDANPRRIWYVTGGTAIVEGQDLGPIGPLPEQAHMADFYIPQRGIFAIGSIYVTTGNEREPVRPTVS